MVQVNLALKEINCKIVYFGCALGGKTTNLEMVHQGTSAGTCGELTSIATESDRTLFFDYMPLDLGEVGGMRVRFQVYTVPGQIYYNTTRKLVLRGVDGVVFVADSQRSKEQENVESFLNLQECLEEQGCTLGEIPHVIQLNKRDLEDVMRHADMEEPLNPHGAPVVSAVATRNEGVAETLEALIRVMLEGIHALSMESNAKPSIQSMQRSRSVTPSTPVPVMNEPGVSRDGDSRVADDPASTGGHERGNPGGDSGQSTMSTGRPAQDSVVVVADPPSGGSLTDTAIPIEVDPDPVDILESGNEPMAPSEPRMQDKIDPAMMVSTTSRRRTVGRGAILGLVMLLVAALIGVGLLLLG